MYLNRFSVYYTLHTTLTLPKYASASVSVEVFYVPRMNEHCALHHVSLTYITAQISKNIALNIHSTYLLYITYMYVSYLSRNWFL